MMPVRLPDWPWPPPMMGMCRCSCARWMATAATKSACSQQSGHPEAIARGGCRTKIYVADSGIYSEANMRQLNAAGSSGSVACRKPPLRPKRCCKKAVRTGNGPRMAASSGIVGHGVPTGQRTLGHRAHLGQSSEHRPPCNGRSDMRRRVGSGSAGIWARGALPVKPMLGRPWGGN